MLMNEKAKGRSTKVAMMHGYDIKERRMRRRKAMQSIQVLHLTLPPILFYLNRNNSFVSLSQW
jgi:hypothetical protein